ncbi:MAG TPA: SWIM zinc finger family protein [Roseiflexaceae bacterium]|nr:SWIM zinc finger family protein [Roseiflexaceae bacterium]
MSVIPGLSETAIRSNTSPESFGRGYSYFEDGAVADVALRGHTLQAQVEGSQYTPYRVNISFSQNGITSASCTCPYDWGGWCKHIVAVLLTCLHEGEDIETRPALGELLADLDRTQLQALLVGLAEHNPELADAIERQAALMRLANAAPQAHQASGSARRSPIDQESIRRQVRIIMQSAARDEDEDDYDYYDDEGDPGEDIAAQVREIVEQATRFTAGGDARSALAILEAITDEFLNGYGEFYDDYEEMYGEYEGAASDVFAELADAWAEAILSPDLSADERRTWAKRLTGWRDEAADVGEEESFAMAVTAAEQGWDYPPLQRVLAGEIGVQGAWEGESPDYADELALVRLRILERQGRQQEYLYLAEAEGQLDRYVVMLAKIGRTEEAVEEGLKYLATPQEALETAKVLSERGDPEAALRIAEHGLALTAPEEPFPGYHLNSEHNKAPLAEWATDLAAGMGESERAERAAEIAFRASPSLKAYGRAVELAGERSDAVKAVLLKHLRQASVYGGDAKIDIFLHENRIDDAIAVVSHRDYYGSGLARVMDAALATRPDWVIKKASAEAEEIIDAGKAQYYDAAVDWLRRVRDAYRSAGRTDEWRKYVQSLRTEHGRKHKLMGLMERL